MLNLSKIVTAVQMNIGIYSIALPFEEPTPKIIADVIQTQTLPIFSNYHPYYETMTFSLITKPSGLDKPDPTAMQEVDHGSNWKEYLLPDVFHNREILFVRRVEYKDNTVTGMSYYGGFPITGGLIQQSMIANASAKLAAKMIPKITFDWKPPRRLRIYNAINSSTINVDFAFMQDPSLQSIESTCYQSFLDLATLDTKIFLYNTLKHYPEINSVYGNIALKIDDWQAADGDRKQLLENWDNTYIMDQQLYEYI